MPSRSFPLEGGSNSLHLHPKIFHWLHDNKVCIVCSYLEIFEVFKPPNINYQVSQKKSFQIWAVISVTVTCYFIKLQLESNIQCSVKNQKNYMDSSGPLSKRLSFKRDNGWLSGTVQTGTLFWDASCDARHLCKSQTFFVFKLEGTPRVSLRKLSLADEKSDVGKIPRHHPFRYQSLILGW